MLWVGLLIGIGCLLTLSWAYFERIAVWQTLVFTLLVFCQFANALVIRSERELLWQQGLFSNLPLLWSVMIGILLQLAVIYFPPLNEVFETRPLPAPLLGVCFLLPLVIMTAVGAEKWLVRQGLSYAPPTPEAQIRRFRVRAFVLAFCRWLVFLAALFYSVPADGKLH